MEKKFKIWDKKHKRWFHGHNDPSRPESTEAISLFGETILFGNMMVDQNTDKQISLERLNDLVAIQYTGLKDNNNKGNEIYFDDVVDIAGYGNLHIETMSDLIILYDSLTEGDVGEIVGNVYENPELLENNQ